MDTWSHGACTVQHEGACFQLLSVSMLTLNSCLVYSFVHIFNCIISFVCRQQASVKYLYTVVHNRPYNPGVCYGLLWIDGLVFLERSKRRTLACFVAASPTILCNHAQLKKSQLPGEQPAHAADVIRTPLRRINVSQETPRIVAGPAPLQLYL